MLPFISRTHYEVLGVSRGASIAEIDAATYQKALEFRSIRIKNGAQTAEVRQIYEAATTLLTPQKRLRYDKNFFGKCSPRPRAPSPPPQSSTDILNDPESRSRPRHRTQNRQSSSHDRDKTPRPTPPTHRFPTRRNSIWLNDDIDLSIVVNLPPVPALSPSPVPFFPPGLNNSWLNNARSNTISPPRAPTPAPTPSPSPARRQSNFPRTPLCRYSEQGCDCHKYHRYADIAHEEFLQSYMPIVRLPNCDVGANFARLAWERERQAKQRKREGAEREKEEEQMIEDQVLESMMM